MTLPPSHENAVRDPGVQQQKAEGLGHGEAEHQGAGGTRLVILLLLPMLAMIAVFQGVSQVLLPAQLQEIDPANKVANLGAFIVICSLTAVVGILAGGAISDRTRTRWGRRAPWLVIMSIVSVAFLMGMRSMSSVAALTLCGSLLWFSACFYQAALTALVPDRVPISKRGKASAILGLGIPLGLLLGVNLAAQISADAAYFTLAAIFLIATFLFVILAPEPPSPTTTVASAEASTKTKRTLNVVAMVTEFFSAFRSLDFTLVFASRFFLCLAYFAVTGYFYYMLQDYIGAENLPGGNVARAVGTAGTVTTLFWIPTALAAGWLADRLNRLKLFVGICSLGMVATMLVPIASPTWQGLLVFSALQGAFFGTYLGVDLALMSLVLPNKETQGRDMAILAVALSGTTIIAPAIASMLIAWGGYPSLFAFGAIMALLGGISVFLVRGVR